MEWGSPGLFLALSNKQLWLQNGAELVLGPTTGLDLRALHWLNGHGLLIYGVTDSNAAVIALWPWEAGRFAEEITKVHSFALPNSGIAHVSDFQPCVSPHGKFVAFFEGECDEAPRLRVLQTASKAIEDVRADDGCPVDCVVFHPEEDAVLFILERPPSAGAIHQLSQDFPVSGQRIWRLEIEDCGGLPSVGRRGGPKQKVMAEVDGSAQSLTFLKIADTWKLVIVCAQAVLVLDPSFDPSGRVTAKPQLVVPGSEDDSFISAFSSEKKLLCLRENLSGERAVSLFEVK